MQSAVGSTTVGFERHNTQRIDKPLEELGENRQRQRVFIPNSSEREREHVQRRGGLWADPPAGSIPPRTSPSLPACGQQAAQWQHLALRFSPFVKDLTSLDYHHNIHQLSPPHPILPAGSTLNVTLSIYLIISDTPALHIPSTHRHTGAGRSRGDPWPFN